MANTLTVVKTLVNSGWSISASLNSGGTLPREIFIYSNTGTTTLGSYQGVLNALDFQRIQIWTGVIIPSFGNILVRHHTATILLEGTEDPDEVINGLKSSVQTLSTQFQALQSSTQIFNIT